MIIGITSLMTAVVHYDRETSVCYGKIVDIEAYVGAGFGSSDKLILTLDDGRKLVIDMLSNVCTGQYLYDGKLSFYVSQEKK